MEGKKIEKKAAARMRKQTPITLLAVRRRDCLLVFTLIPHLAELYPGAFHISIQVVKLDFFSLFTCPGAVFSVSLIQR
jgi:hypothetical protein